MFFKFSFLEGYKNNTFLVYRTKTIICKQVIVITSSGAGLHDIHVIDIPSLLSIQP